jgi:DivIVA domain-containing protein
MANLTPADVRNVTFSKPPLGKRGYDEQEVDTFLDRVESTLTALTEEIHVLRARLGTGTAAAATGHIGAVGNDVVAELHEIKIRIARIEAAMARQTTPFPLRDPLLGTSP